MYLYIQPVLLYPFGIDAYLPNRDCEVGYVSIKKPWFGLARGHRDENFILV